MRILINDFIGGVLDRGIPLYVRNLIRGLREEGFEVTVLRAPAIFRLLPRSVFYAIAVLFEQTVSPLVGFVLRADMTIYPYNSIALADILTKRGRIVVHDLEQLNRPLSFSKIYYLLCYRLLKWCDAPLFVISELTRQRLTRSGLFGNGPLTLLPNTFYAFERLLRLMKPRQAPAKSILLCTGSTANKDLETLIADYLPKVVAERFAVSILGLHKASDAPRLAALQSAVDSGQIKVLGRLSDRAVARAYRAHRIVWVHSLREGFGRCVVEGRLAGTRVIASDIAEFVQLADRDVALYRNAAEFMSALQALAPIETPPQRYSGYPYRELLRNAMRPSAETVAAPAAPGLHRGT